MFFSNSVGTEDENEPEKSKTAEEIEAEQKIQEEEEKQKVILQKIFKKVSFHTISKAKLTTF